jgi:pyruvate formate lyase activating enzyme
MQKALFWKTEGNKIRCNLCSRLCLIPKGVNGFCNTRKHIDGTLYATIYGEVSAMTVDPIEKKPFFHYFPGSLSLSISTIGCTFRCKFCQNYDISHSEKNLIGKEPYEIAEEAKRLGCKTVSYTYNEPTVFMEYALDTAKEVLKRGLQNVFVTNGYMTPEVIDYVSKYIQAMTVGIKGSLNKEFSGRFMSLPNPDAIKNSLLEMKRKGIHIELTDLLVTKYGDNIDDIRKFAQWIYDNLGPDTPVHFTRYHPDWRLTEIPPTPIKTIEKAHTIARKEGLRYVYSGNISGHSLENTYCPECKELLIKRNGINLDKWNIKDKMCPNCGTNIFYLGNNNLS